ncbi:hypothetical protein JCM3774_006260 [Rhodotorula dairenensis]
MNSPPSRPRPQRGSGGQGGQDAVSSSTSPSSPVSPVSSAGEEGPSTGTVTRQRRSCQGCRQRKARCTREVTGCSNCRARNEPCIYADTLAVCVQTPEPSESVNEQLVRIRAEVASLRAEVASLRQTQMRNTTAPPVTPASPAPTATYTLPLAAGVAPPSLANRLPIPSMPIGANHFRRPPPPVTPVTPVTPTRPRTDAVNLVSYGSPVTLYPTNHTSAALLANPDYAAASGNGGPLPAPTAAPPAVYPPPASYYIPPRGNHLPNPYAVQPTAAPNVAYGAPPPPPNPQSGTPADDLDCPGDVIVAAPSSWYATPPRPSVAYPLSHERPDPGASAMPPPPPPPAAPSTAPSCVHSFPPATAVVAAVPPHAAPLTVAPTATLVAVPSATPRWYPPQGFEAYEPHHVPTAVPQYRVVTRSPSAPAMGGGDLAGATTTRLTSTSAPGMLWSVPRAGGHGPQGSGGSGGNGLEHGTGMQQQPYLALAGLGGPYGNGLTLFSGPGSSRRPSLQQSVTDWQAMLEDSPPQRFRTPPSRTPVDDPSPGGGGRGGGGGAGADAGGRGERVEGSLLSMMTPETNAGTSNVADP